MQPMQTERSGSIAETVGNGSSLTTESNDFRVRCKGYGLDHRFDGEGVLSGSRLYSMFGEPMFLGTGLDAFTSPSLFC